MRLSVAMLLVALTAGAAYAQSTPEHAARADSLLRRMTLAEKLGQLAMASGTGEQTGPDAHAVTDQQIRAGQVGAFLNIYGAEATRRMQRIAVEESRLRIPLLFAYDVLHGFRTVFPMPLAEAASFDSSLVSQGARVAAIEASAAGIHWTFAPMVDIARDPRWGRIVEGSGEDPYLGSVMAAARVRGFQGERLSDRTSIVATPKHFAGYGAAEGGRDYAPVDISERALWETHFPPFEAAIRAGAGSVMAAFNDVAGVPAHASRWLLRDVLRDRLKFPGPIISDWNGVEELIGHGVAGSPAEAALLALRSGIDIEMMSSTYTWLAGAVAHGTIPVALIDSAVLRVLRTKEALGLFDDPYRGVTTERERRAMFTAEHRALARRLARESIVLLENDGSLPLRRELRSLAVIGPLADDTASAMGSWTAAGRPQDATTVLAGIRAAVARSSTRVSYVRGMALDSADVRGIPAAERLATSADAVVLVIGESRAMSGEGQSRASIELPGAQLELAQRVIRAARRADRKKPVAVVLMNGRPLAIPWLADSAPAIVESWFLGTEHGPAVADVLFGDANPSGKLPVTVPRATGQIPIHYSRRPNGRPADATGRVPGSYIDVALTPLWPFGHGRSYTTFTYGAVRVAGDTIRTGDSVAVSVDVTNAGGRQGDEVVQLYLRDEIASVAQPVRRLVRFRRIGLRAGKTRTLRFVLGARDLSLYDLEMRRVVEPGGFTLYAGGSSAARDSTHFTVAGDTLVLALSPVPMR